MRLIFFVKKLLTLKKSCDILCLDFERRIEFVRVFQSNLPKDRPKGLRPYGQPGPLPICNESCVID